MVLSVVPVSCINIVFNTGNFNYKDAEKENLSTELKEVVQSTQHMAVQTSTSLQNVNKIYRIR